MPFEYEADSSQVDTAPKHVPEGDYEFTVQQTPKHSITSTNRNMLTMYCIIENGDYAGRRIRFNLVFIPKGEPHHDMTVKALKAFGLEVPAQGKFTVDESEFMDKIFRAHVRVKNEKYIPEGSTEPITVPKSEIGWFILDQKEGSQIPKKDRDEEEVPF